MADKPNVLLICADHWSGLLSRPGGHPVVMTPTLAQLAPNGTWFGNAYSPAPTCIPARRSLMTGMSPRAHGDRVFNEYLPMPDVPTLAQCFRDAGYQAHAVGKLHVYPQRDRIGFDEAIINEEGRHHLGGGSDDWELYLAEQGFAGQEYAAGGSNNDYNTRVWHLPDHLHPTNWATREMCRMVRRRDPGKPAFWYLSFVDPHPPMWPLQAYMDLYRDVPMDPPVIGDWAIDPDSMPYALRVRGAGAWTSVAGINGAPRHEVDLARRAFYALITHIDHQLRVIIGTLREEGVLDNTIIALTSDHGDMLGDHGRWAKGVMYEMSTKVPLLIVPLFEDARLRVGEKDDRLAELRDVMPTLLELAGVDVPGTVDGRSLLGEEGRDHVYGEHWEGEMATRMVRDHRFKLVYYPVGNRSQLFDLADDPRETHDLSDSAEHTETRHRLTEVLVENLYGPDLEWVRRGKLVGLPDAQPGGRPDRSFGSQRGLRFF